jgi:glutamine cyclotransferase
MLLIMMLEGCAVTSTSTILPTPTIASTPVTQPTSTPQPLPTTTSTQTFPFTSTYEIINTYPHDPNAFTQGLVFYEGRLFESTGLNGQSSLREVELETGKALRSISLEPQFFAEGLALVDNRLIQLTWKNQLGFVYDRDTFKQTHKFQYEHEGWGITFDGKSLIVSDGTPSLRFYDPKTFSETKQIEVRHRGQPVFNLNELEWIASRAEIFANVWQTDLIARIDPATGNVKGWIDLSGLLAPQYRGDVLNGIAYDAKSDRLFVTGKLWNTLFEIRLR